MMSNDFRGRTALVTGGTRGIGAAVARALAAAGCEVIACGRTVVEMPGIRVVRGDVTEPAEVAAMVEALERLDIVVNCAGTIRRREEYEMAAFAEVMQTNVDGTMRVCLAAKPKFPASGGAIVTIASMLSYFGAPHAPAYAASKAGVVQLTKSLAAAWAKDGIRVNAVAPGWIRTELTQAVRQDKQREAGILARTPMGRWGEPEEVAEAVLFLCSPAARFITGALLPVDGGYSSV
jgi:NAD(P)-dependent dehydrogenase (short-subunit alcohol dehydrogenase family)